VQAKEGKMRSSLAVAVAIFGVTGAALVRSRRARELLKREAELLGLRAYLSAVDRREPHGSFISEIRHTDCAEGSWLARAYGRCAEDQVAVVAR
jgi:hypothetical protein